jgi:hypothetical protein
MSDMSTFRSRPAELKCSAEEFYYFITDIRNLWQFIPADTISNLMVEQDSCSFQAGMLGAVKVWITEKVIFSRVVFTGGAVQVKNFSLVMDIRESSGSSAEVNVTILAEMNPFLKMIAADQVEQFLEKLTDEMERFDGWNDTKEQNQSP